MGPRDAPAGKALSESVEIVELASSRLHEEVADEHPNQELHYPLLFVQQMDGPSIRLLANNGQLFSGTCSVLFMVNL
jgi:hypothetical protein